MLMKITRLQMSGRLNLILVEPIPSILKDEVGVLFVINEICDSKLPAKFILLRNRK